MDYHYLHSELISAFIEYQFNLDFPFPKIDSSTATATATQIQMNSPEYKYRNDPIFKSKVDWLVSGVINIVQEAERERR